MSLHGEERDLELARGPVPEGLVVALGSAPTPAGDELPVVRFASERTGRDERLVAPAGTDLWRRQPWPAADDLFDLPPPPPDAPVLIVGDSERLPELLRERDVAAHAAPALTRSQLEAAGVVVLLYAAGFPVHAFAVLAARRLLVLSDVAPLFGLQEGIHCLLGRSPEEIADAADAATKAPTAFDAMRALGALAAETQRASRVYARLAVDVALEREGEAKRARSASST